MKNIRSCCAVLVLALALLWLAPAARAQETGDDTQPPRCTDLSGKIPLPCPSPSGPASDTVGVPDESTMAATKAAGEARPRGREHPDKDSGAGSVATAGPAAEQPYAAAVRPTAISQPSAADPRAAIGLHPRTPPEPEPVPPVAASSPTSRLSHSPETTLIRNLVQDQKNIWTSPLHLRLDDVHWLAPLLGGTAAMIAADTSIQREVPTGANFRKQSNSLSNYGVAAFAGVAGGSWLWGIATHNDHMRETGILSGEAALDSFALTYAIKYITHRDRPNEGNGNGNFWSNGDSFPSEHAAAAWSVATVFAHEYPGPLSKLLAYGGAAAISAARVTANQHFTSDAFVGSAIGYLIGRQVYQAHHDHDTGDAAYGTFERTRAAEGPHDPRSMGSTFVPLDSWVYDAMDRLAALRYINSAFAGLRPWTRLECARLLHEAASQVQSDSAGRGSDEALRLYQALEAEFVVESRRLGGDRNVGAQLESVYTRFNAISGKPLNDGYHFGQTIINDFGRPYQEGFNAITGFSSHAEAGPLAFYVRGEYQHAPSAPALPLTARQTIATVDDLPVTPPGSPTPGVDQFRLLDAYIAMKFDNWQVSFGKQSLLWGPGLGGPMLFSDNAQPIDMLRISRVSPFTLPTVFRWLGPVRTEVFLGRLSGYEFVASPSGIVGQFGRALDSQPFIEGMKFSFKPTPDLEIGFSRTNIYGGPGYPLTTHTFLRNLFSTGNTKAGAPDKPGDRRSALDLTYRIPKLRDWLTFYADGFTDDEYSPIAYFDRSAWRAGIYVPQLPRLHKLDLRAEGTYTDNPLGGALGHGFYYFNFTWRSGYTNNGSLIGSWIGREGQGAQAWATYHISPKSFIQLNFRHQKVSQEFISSGGTLTDVGLRSDLWVRSAVSLSSFVQYERWTFPVLAPGAQSNVSTSVQLNFWPHWGRP